MCSAKAGETAAASWTTRATRARGATADVPTSASVTTLLLMYDIDTQTGGKFVIWQIKLISHVHAIDLGCL